jgi:hypothetical protein
VRAGSREGGGRDTCKARVAQLVLNIFFELNNNYKFQHAITINTANSFSGLRGIRGHGWPSRKVRGQVAKVVPRDFGHRRQES